MDLTFASYNIHKGVGLDRRRDPERILAVLHELDADVVALQEVDRRFGRRAAVLPVHAIRDHGRYHLVPFAMLPDSMGWHGNALLVRHGIEVQAVTPVPLPTLEPRGAVCADLSVDGRPVRVVGMHLDLSGLRRRQQLRAVQVHLAQRATATPTVLMGDFNEWSVRGGALRALAPGWRVLETGPSFPARRPLARLDRIVVCGRCECLGAGVHHSALSTVASDHLPIFARLRLGSSHA
ncbi:MAG: endonuclease/exonuclease/phosphatase family protein [Sphingomonadales bacterium]|nr:endonuclease/exonuclease/phosphatase family protein [Sphingomonadales bacterium]